jgi:hypothetical protein
MSSGRYASESVSIARSTIEKCFGALDGALAAEGGGHARSWSTVGK